MESKKLIKVLEITYQKTIEGKLIWEATSTKDVFQVALPTGAFEIRKHQFDPISSFSFYIYNGNGDLIETIDDDQINETIINMSGPMFLDRLFTVVRSQALNIEKTIDDILIDLDGK